jgi:hypothetical protein
MAPRSNRDLIELELTSLIQKLAFLRGGGMTPRSFPTAEYDVIEAFGLSCCRLMERELHRATNSGTYPLGADGHSVDEDTQPGWRSRIRKP